MKDKNLRVTMPDGSEWDIPLSVIIEDKADYLGHTTADTLKAFEEFPDVDWAVGNMNWEDVETHAVQVKAPVKIDYTEGWLDGEKEIITDDQNENADRGKIEIDVDEVLRNVIQRLSWNIQDFIARREPPKAWTEEA